MRKICVLTGTRAEYGLLRWVLEGIRRSPLLELQLIATGAHLSPEFGLTVNAIVEDGFRVNRRVEMLLSSDTPVGITKSMGIGMIGLADALAEMRPDLMLVVGDRYEIFCGVAAALIARIPVAHIHGGEVTEGVIDESIRHSVTKMSHIHFVSAEPYRKRVIQLGENPQHVFSVGGLGIDNILRLPLLSRPELEQLLEFKLKERNLLVTFHPDTLDNNSSSKQLKELLWALSTLGNTALIFTMPNADTGSRLLFEQILAFCAKHPNARTFKSLGQVGYLSCVRHVDGVVGNSSSGIIEVPSFKKGTINIGDRQRGRLRAGSIID
jgi:GDP/UDP-N,N'-diacetylbacillosamine 2-epimerase (hydrolysing)